MAWTDLEKARIVAIEEQINKVLKAINNLASKKQLQQLLMIKQTEIDALKARVDLLEAQVATLQTTVTS